MPMVDTRIQLIEPPADYILNWESALDIAWMNSTDKIGDDTHLTYPKLYLSRKQGAGDAPKNIIHLGDEQPLSGEYTWKTGGEMFIPQAGPGYYFELVWTEKRDGRALQGTAIGNYFTILRYTPTSTQSLEIVTETTVSRPTGTSSSEDGEDGTGDALTTRFPDASFDTTLPNSTTFPNPNINLQDESDSAPLRETSSSQNTKSIAIGASVGVAVIGILLAVVILMLCRKRKREKQLLVAAGISENIEKGKKGGSSEGTSELENGVQRWVNGVPTEVSSPQTAVPAYRFRPVSLAEVQGESEHRELDGGRVRPQKAVELPVGKDMAVELDATSSQRVLGKVYVKGDDEVTQAQLEGRAEEMREVERGGRGVS